MALIIRTTFESCEILTVKFSLNPITTQNTAYLRNAVRRLQLVIFSYSYSAYHQIVNLKLLR